MSNDAPTPSQRRLRIIGLLAGPLVFAAVAFIPSGLHDMAREGMRPHFAAAVAAWMVVWWFFEAMPIGVTACLPLLLFPLTNISGNGFVAEAKSFLVSYDYERGESVPVPDDLRKRLSR